MYTSRRIGVALLLSVLIGSGCTLDDDPGHTQQDLGITAGPRTLKLTAGKDRHDGTSGRVRAWIVTAAGQWHYVGAVNGLAREQTRTLNLPPYSGRIASVYVDNDKLTDGVMVTATVWDFVSTIDYGPEWVKGQFGKFLEPPLLEVRLCCDWCTNNGPGDWDCTGCRYVGDLMCWAGDLVVDCESASNGDSVGRHCSAVE